MIESRNWLDEESSLVSTRRSASRSATDGEGGRVGLPGGQGLAAESSACSTSRSTVVRLASQRTCCRTPNAARFPTSHMTCTWTTRSRSTMRSSGSSLDTPWPNFRRYLELVALRRSAKQLVYLCMVHGVAIDLDSLCDVHWASERA